LADIRHTRSFQITQVALNRADLPVRTVPLARYLLGKVLVRQHPDGTTSGRIVETEAYPPGDPAGHAFRGPTPRNLALYLECGHAYVYLAYGISFLCNVSSELPGVGAGVLLRALEPLDGIALMQARRRTTFLHDLARGPGRLAMAMAIDRTCDGIDLCAAGPLWLDAGPRATGPVGRSRRIGIKQAADRPLRFYERHNPFVSGPKHLCA
jgi:DNA-3-methyladenine glycosylase